uniref:C2 domain-containing protein n=1 Tax=Plectus sambesii TaxID=2011161 RepID=A0A914WN77_9BILA
MARSPSLFHLLFFLSSTFLLSSSSTSASSSSSEDESFWLTMELSLISLTTSCLSLVGCGRPRLKLVASKIGPYPKNNDDGDSSDSYSNSAAADVDEQRSLSWPAADLLGDNVAAVSGAATGRLNTQSFIIHWPKGKPSDVGVICEIAGVDPTYGFPRVCDSSTLAWPFKFNETGVVGGGEELRHAVNDGATVILTVSGKCFNASLAVTPHLARCPWCPPPPPAVADNAINPNNESDAYFDASAQLLRPLAPVWLVILLAVIAFFVFVAFIVSLTAYVRERRQKKWLNGGSRSTSSKPKRSTSNHDRVHAHVLRSDSVESKYDIPWDQKFRPLPYWLRGEMSSLAIGAADGVHTVASLRGHHSSSPSPRGTSIIGSDLSPALRTTTDDSGLESV